MSSVVEYLFAREVAQDVYGPADGALHGTLPSNGLWLFDQGFNGTGELSTGPGFYAYALRPSDPTDNRRVLAFRGTEMLHPSDLFSDGSSIGQNQFSGSVPDAVNAYLADNYRAGLDTELIGHSLGGALVQWAINDSNLEKIRTVVDPQGLGVSSAEIAQHLHFFTFNAPGITLSPGALSDPAVTTSLVNGEHHVIEFQLTSKSPFLVGDPIHLLGGVPVGGHVVEHQVRWADVGGSGLFAHTIREPAWWREPIAVNHVISYAPDLSIAQATATLLTSELSPGEITNEWIAGRPGRPSPSRQRTWRMPSTSRAAKVPRSVSTRGRATASHGARGSPGT